VPFIRLMPRTNFQEGVADPVFNLQEIIDGKFDDSLRKWAVDARTISVPIIVEFGTEVNGDWFPWSGIYNGGGKTDGYGDPNFPDGPERFRDAYRHIINLFREESANKITWCFHVFPPKEISENEDLKKSWNDVSNYYPGDNYIDWVGISVYGRVEPDSDWKSFEAIMDKSYPEISRITENKPLAVFEWATAEAEDEKQGDKTSWIENSLQLLQDGRYPRIKAISYWDEKWDDDSGTVIDLRINSSPGAAFAYKKAISSPFFLSQAEFY
jgi:beta-mannanase